MSTVTLNIKGKVAYLSLNRAHKYNALTQDMWHAIAQACDSLMQDRTVRVLVLKAEGQKAFCAGADIQELHEMLANPDAFSASNQIVQEAQQKLAALPFATIAQINGVCVGGGMGLAMCCDFRIAVNDATFAITPSKLGLLYSLADTKRLVDLVGLPRAKELLYLGKKINADTAHHWGLITQVVERASLSEATEALVQQILSVSGYSVSGTKRSLQYLGEMPSNDALDNEARLLRLFDDAFHGDDFKEGAAAFTQKRPARFS
ncbi:Crotonyl-CoA hydratase [Paraglaciecola mesophila]|uniref:Crotonyl-CoA hydratase n=1 Tax=Paraglaciecola mesophila TaxID=197222 RepID=A0A857JR11_9ALTE|nr:enoyl-CoA hydratase/isomerase family protein [Paraglaciecola mesophila]QHJ13868.1 Crotonyl-CoA hydratase [Paraglaciecola mesophila]